MTLLVKIILLCVLGGIAVYFVRRIILTSFTISELSNKKNRTDITMQRHGIVFNKKTKTLEADQSMIEPF